MIRFTADVFGSTGFPGIARFGVADGNDAFTTAPDEVQFAAGVSGNQIVNGMRSEMENLSSFDGNVAGDSLLVPDGCEGFFSAPPEYQMSYDVVEPCPSGTPPVDLPGFDLTGTRREVPVIGLGLLGEAALARGRLRVEVRLGDQSLTTDVRFEPLTPVRDVLRELDGAFDRRSSELKYGRYVGLVNEFLIFEIPNEENVPAGITQGAASGGIDPGFRTTNLYALPRQPRS